MLKNSNVSACSFFFLYFILRQIVLFVQSYIVLTLSCLLSAFKSNKRSYTHTLDELDALSRLAFLHSMCFCSSKNYVCVCLNLTFTLSLSLFFPVFCCTCTLHAEGPQAVLYFHYHTFQLKTTEFIDKSRSRSDHIIYLY